VTPYLLATTNPGKLREIRAILAGAPVRLIGLDEMPPVEAPEETGRTFAENARLKALYYAKAYETPAIAEDSGLEIDALDQAPGVESARYGGADTTYPEKFALIYAALTDRPAAPRTARFVCTLAVADGERIVFEARGTVEGVIADSPSGDGGFGYDPIFYYPPYGRTLAEVNAEEKAAVSHRGAAFRKLAEFLRTTVLTGTAPRDP
jgi:XTP/dITP diphosphohydrolase